MRADDIMHVFFCLANICVVALPTELLSQVIKYSSVGSAVAILRQPTLFQGRRPSEERANFCILNGTLQLFFKSRCIERLIEYTWQAITPKLE